MPPRRLFSAHVIPHADQRYATTGDWQIAGDGFGDITVLVSDLRDARYNFLVGIHELIEARLCKESCITDEIVCRYDTLYEAARPSGVMRSALPVNDLLAEFKCACPITEVSEPGDDIHAPYYTQHQVATGIERILAAALGVSWMAYEAENLDLYETEITPLAGPR